MIKKKHFFMLFAAEPDSYTGTDSLIATVTDLKNSRIIKMENKFTFQLVPEAIFEYFCCTEMNKQWLDSIRSSMKIK